MKFFSLLVALLLMSAACLGQGIVMDDHFPESRVVDALECTKYMASRTNFLICVNQLICLSDITKSVIGKTFGIKILMPTKDDNGNVIWEPRIWESNMTDTQTKKWCAMEFGAK